MSVKLQPLRDQVVLEKQAAEEKTKSGIVLPDSAQEKPQTAKVVAVGPGKTLDNGSKLEPDVKVGDLVYYAKFSGTNVDIDDKEYIILSENDILAILK